jgi:CheY-like chemotaxis protein
MPKVLIVEDTDDIALALQALIEYEGHEAFVASTAEKGYELTLKMLPDLVVMDIVLPTIDGLDLTRRIRANSEIKQPIIFCVSSYVDGIEEEALMAGCDRVFNKTTFISNYQQLLSGYLGKRHVVQS